VNRRQQDCVQLPRTRPTLVRRRTARTRTALQLPLGDLPLLGNRGGFDEVAQRNLHRELLLHARKDAQGEQRAPADREEVIVHIHGLAPQRFGPDPAHDLLDVGVCRGRTLARRRR